MRKLGGGLCRKGVGGNCNLALTFSLSITFNVAQITWFKREPCELDVQVLKCIVSEFNEFKPRLKSAKNRFQLSAGLNLEKFNTILSGINHI